VHRHSSGAGVERLSHSDGGNDRAAADVEPTPPVVPEIFGPAAPLAIRYAELLAGSGVVRGLLGPREAAVVWSRHILNSAAIAPLIPTGLEVIDLGSGAGLPGIVLALARPDLTVTLVEPMARRCAFLTEVVAELGLPGVCVDRTRAEDAAGRLSADVVVARALAELRRLIPLALPLLRPRGELLAIKGRDAAQELTAAAGVLAQRDARGDILSVDTPGSAQTTTVVRVRVSLPDVRQ
jgi:16S rRNA (guanine527-N7)-methyltransferase